MSTAAVNTSTTVCTMLSLSLHSLTVEIVEVDVDDVVDVELELEDDVEDFDIVDEEVCQRKATHFVRLMSSINMVPGSPEQDTFIDIISNC